MIHFKFAPCLLVFATFRQVASHGYLAKPTSKNAADMQSYKLPFHDYYMRANWWVDKAHLNDDPHQKPWSAPGQFNYETAYDIAQQVFHPCGCFNPGRVDFCAGVTLASEFGEVTPGHDASAGFPKITPPSWAPGSKQETAFNFYANHAGGYLYMLCKKSTFDQCKKDHLPQPVSTATHVQTAAYLKCVWDCFEANVLEFAPDSQKIQYGDRNDLTVNVKTVTKGPSGVLPKGAVWREAPIPDAHMVSTGHFDHGRCTWDAISKTSFSNEEAKEKFTASFGDEQNCDGGPDNHLPKTWHIKDMVRVPANLPQGEYILSWRWECGVANQLWSNCADVNVTSSSGSIPEPEPEAEPEPQPEPPPACNDIVGDVPGALPAAWLPDWLDGVEITCEVIQRIAVGDEFCNNKFVKSACCFCGGGFKPEPEPTTTKSKTTAIPTTPTTPAPKSCLKDSEHLTAGGNWNAYTCQVYKDLGQAYCAHDEVAMCCFCSPSALVSVHLAPHATPTKLKRQQRFLGPALTQGTEALQSMDGGNGPKKGYSLIQEQVMTGGPSDQVVISEEL